MSKNKLQKNHRVKRQWTKPVTINKAQDEFARLVGAEGMNQTEAARRAWPNNTYPSQRAQLAMKQAGVKIMIQKYQLRSIRTDATKVCYDTLIEVAQDKEEGGAARVKAAIELHEKFGFGKIKDIDGDEKRLEDMEESELDDFIANAEKQLALQDSKDPNIVDAEIVEPDRPPASEVFKGFNKD